MNFDKIINDIINNKRNARSNANLDELSFSGKENTIISEIMKQYALENLMSSKSAFNHKNNLVYIHDLDKYAVGMHNCLSIPIDDLLKNGFTTRQTDIRPAGSISSALQLVAVIFQLQSLQQFGGVSATHLDWSMVPYIRKSFNKHYKDGIKHIATYLNDNDKEYIIDSLSDDLSISDSKYTVDEAVREYAYKMTIKETQQAAESMIHNLNSLQSRSGGQLPFSSINFGTCTEEEGRIVTGAILDKLYEGTGPAHLTSIFPCVIFQCMKGVNRKPTEPNYDLFLKSLKCTAKRLYPNYCNCDWSGNAGYDKNDPRTYFSTMGCRTANGWDINGFGQLKDGRGNICPVTIILPTLAMEAVKYYDTRPCGDFEEDTIEFFMQRLEVIIDEAKDTLIERFEHICSQSPDSAKFMWQNNTMAGYIPEEGIRSAMKHGTLAVGQLGLAEALQILIGEDHTTEKGMCLAKRIEQLFKDKCAKFKEQYKLNFGVYFTPAESLCHTALMAFRQKYGIIENVSDKEFFTNSMHVPVWKKMSPFDKIDIESQLTGYSSAGCITYVELDSSVKNNVRGLQLVVDYAMNHDIPYFAINVPNDQCCDCGYTDEFNDKCPVCGSTNILQLRRVTGYLTGDFRTAFNTGKQNEVENRVKHSGSREYV